MNLSNNTFSITTRPIDNFFKNIVRLTQIFEGARAIFGGLIIKILNISIYYNDIFKTFGGALASPP